MSDAKPFLCAGEWKTTEEVLEVRSPYNDELSGRVCMAGEKEAEEATAAAMEAFEETRLTPAWRRSEILWKIADEIDGRKEEFASTITSENGKPITDARMEVGRAASVFRIAAEEAKRIGGEYIPMDAAPGGETRAAVNRRFPLGPVFGITPFNFPLNLAAHKVAPALAAGDTIVIKPASTTPISSLLLAEACDNAGAVKGSVSVLPCKASLAEKMAHDDRYKALTFTGSPDVGWALKAKSGRKKVTLELGGNAGCIVHSDADIELAAARCTAGAFVFSGQVCISLQRIFVHEKIFDEFAGRFADMVGGLKVGDPREEDTRLGPMINESEAQRAKQWIDEASAGGARIVCGGDVDGTMLQPTILAETGADMKVSCMEIFAPVVTLTPYDDVYEAIEMVDDSEYGLQAGLFTNDARIINRAYRDIEVGGLMVNEVPTFRLDHMPYGGVKMSGMGREGLRYAIEELTEPKLLVYNDTSLL